MEHALRQGQPGQAALDGFEAEPPPPDAPLLHMENALATPHLGYVEKSSYELYFARHFKTLSILPTVRRKMY